MIHSSRGSWPTVLPPRSGGPWAPVPRNPVVVDPDRSVRGSGGSMIDALEAVPEMRGHPLRGRRAVARDEGRRDGLVLREGAVHPPGEPRRDVVHHPVDLVADLAHRARDLLVPVAIA